MKVENLRQISKKDLENKEIIVKKILTPTKIEKVGNKYVLKDEWINVDYVKYMFERGICKIGLSYEDIRRGVILPFFLILGDETKEFKVSPNGIYEAQSYNAEDVFAEGILLPANIDFTLNYVLSE